MDFAYKKSLGQNFINDESFLSGIVRAIGINKNDTVVEVGTGAGSLTRVLARHAKHVITFEIDTRLEQIIKKNLAGFDNIDLRFGDAMSAPNLPPAFKLVANIPYYITSPLLLKFIRTPECREICVLVQDDVAARIVAKPGGKEYGALGITMQAAGDCRIIKSVPRHMFTPKPDVDSAFVQIRKNENPPTSTTFDRLVKGMFSARRKTVLNALKQTLGLDTAAAGEVLTRAGIDGSLRPEQLPPEKFVKLGQIIENSSV